MSGFCCVIFVMLFGSSGRRKQQQVQRVQEENGDLRQLIVQLDKEKDDLKKKMEEKEQLEIK